MLERITLKNFKLHASTTIDAAPITVFIGPNNSGKSSIFQAILGVRQAGPKGSSRFLDPNSHELINLGEFAEVVRHNHKEIQITLSGKIAGSLIPTEPMRLAFAVHVRNNALYFHQGTLESAFGKLKWDFVTASAPAQVSLQVEGSVLRFNPSSHFGLLDVIAIDSPPQTTAEKRKDLNDLAHSIALMPRTLMSSVHPVLPLRGFEEWGYNLPDASARDLDKLTISERSLAIASILAYDRAMEERLSSWLSDFLNIGIKAVLLPGKRVAIRTTRSPGEAERLFVNEGTGANQLPFILIPIGLTPPEETILLCEPEAHLHPKAQSELIRLLLRIANKEKRQFFFETHSEHILHTLLHAVAKGDLVQSDLALYYFENVNGEAKVTRLKIDERGGVEGGLPGFFDHALTELSELLETSKRK